MERKTPLSGDVEEVLRSLDANERVAEELVRDLGEERLNWRPDERSWSIAQCLDHMNAANGAYLVAMREAIEGARGRSADWRGPIRPGLLERLFVRTMEPPPRPRLPAPRKAIPAVRKGRAEVLGEWRRIHAEARGLLQEAAGLDLNRIRFVNPFAPFVRFTVGTGFLVIVAHDRRHLWQAEQVRRHPGFPQPPRTSS